MNKPHLPTVPLLATLASLLWASAFLGGKIALESLPPLHLASYRLIGASIILLLFIRRNPFKGLTQNMPYLILLSFLQTIFLFIAFNIGLNLVKGSYAAIIIGSSPAVTALIATRVMKEERLSVRHYVSIILGVVSIVFLTLGNKNSTPIELPAIIGSFILLMCNVSSAFASIVMKQRFREHTAVQVNTAQIILGTVAVTIIAHMREPIVRIHWSTSAVFSVLYLSGVTAVAVTIWMYLVHRPDISIARIAIYKFIIPSAGALLNWLFAPSDPMTASSLIAVIGMSMAVLISSRGSPGPASYRNAKGNHDMVSDIQRG
ncbi:MAG: DMT family transporter [Sphaerochaetaceae bacterium]|nr:DMT family transporter [Sphaerochaetaceae bacterium]